MTLNELLPSVHALPRADKLRLIQLLAADVASEDGIAVGDSDATYSVWSPYEAFDGAATLLRVLQEEKGSLVTAQRFPYVEIDPSLGAASALPYMPVTLTDGRQEITVSALVDSGAALNVLPYNIGIQLGAVWEEQRVPVRLSGNLAASEARALLLTGRVGDFAPVRLAFGWSRSNNVPVILGQVNFFMEFDVLFCRSALHFEISDKNANES